MRQSVRSAWERKRSFRTGGGCDQMRARRRRWQIRVRAGATCEVRWRLAHERSTSTEMNKIRCQTRIDLAVGHPKYPREFTLPLCRFHHVGICGTGERCTAGRVSVGALSDTSVARRPRYVQRKEPRELQSYAVGSPRRRRRRYSWLGRRRKHLCPGSVLGTE